MERAGISATALTRATALPLKVTRRLAKADSWLEFRVHVLFRVCGALRFDPLHQKRLVEYAKRKAMRT